MAFLNKHFNRFISLPQPVKYFFIGFFTVIVDLGLYNILSIIFDINMFVARVFSLTVGFTTGYFLHKKITFINHDKKIASQMTKYYSIALVGFTLNFVIMKIMLIFSDQLSSELLRKNIPVFVAIGIVFFWNYFMQKYWTFNNKQSILKIK